MTLTAWGLLTGFIGALVVALTTLQLGADEHGYLASSGPSSAKVQRWGPLIGWGFLTIGFALQFAGELLRTTAR